MKALLRQLPRVDDLLFELYEEFEIDFSRDQVKSSINSIIDRYRQEILSGNVDKIAMDQIPEHVRQHLRTKMNNQIKRVINATGTVIHTNLGRSTISKEILNEVMPILSSYNSLEFDLETGQRGSRYNSVESILCDLTGAEAALVVNNNAAAVMLVLNTMAKDKEVIVSRGELVEIGGSFRIPDVMMSSGCILKEVGTTNKTHLFDYERNVHDQTALLLKVHTSNYKILGFTTEVSNKEISDLGKACQIPTYEDLGSGLLLELEQFGISKEPLILESLLAGIDIVSFSGDKLLGASQCGIIVGKRRYIEQMKKNQLLRALRIDKFSLLILEKTLLRYYNEDKTKQEVDTIRRLALSNDEISKKADHFIEKLNSEISKTITIHTLCKFYKKQSTSEVGGGSLPLEKLPTTVLALPMPKPNEFQKFLRNLEIPIVARIENDEIIFDFRTIEPQDYDYIANALVKCLKSANLF